MASHHALPVLNGRFVSQDVYASRAKHGYALLPFRFIPLDDQRYVASNFVGEHIVISRTNLRAVVAHELPTHSRLYDELKAKHFLLDEDSDVAIDLLAAKYRTKQQLLSQLTS